MQTAIPNGRNNHKQRLQIFKCHSSVWLSIELTLHISKMFKFFGILLLQFWFDVLPLSLCVLLLWWIRGLHEESCPKDVLPDLKCPRLQRGAVNSTNKTNSTVIIIKKSYCYCTYCSLNLAFSGALLISSDTSVYTISTRFWRTKALYFANDVESIFLN